MTAHESGTCGLQHDNLCYVFTQSVSMMIQIIQKIFAEWRLLQDQDVAVKLVLPFRYFKYKIWEYKKCSQLTMLMYSMFLDFLLIFTATSRPSSKHFSSYIIPNPTWRLKAAGKSLVLHLLTLTWAEDVRRGQLLKTVLASLSLRPLINILHLSLSLQRLISLINTNGWCSAALVLDVEGVL